MPSDIQFFEGGGGQIIHRCRRNVIVKCAYCDRPHTKLCDADTGNGHTCDKPMCNLHATPGKKPGTDYCPDHHEK